MAVSYVFCEGADTSLDRQLLDKLALPLIVTPVPVGGKGEMPNFIKGYFSQERARENTRYVAFRDRDFEVVEIPMREQIAALHQLHNEKPIYALHRIVIENYLLTPESLYQYLLQTRQGLAHFGLSTQVDVHQLCEDSARSIYFYTIARHVIGNIKRQRPHVAFTWVQESSFLPAIPRRTEESSLGMLIAHFSQLHTYSNTLNADSLEQAFATMQQRMPPNRFLRRESPHDNYQTYCHGKDLITAIEERLAMLSGQRNYTLGERWWKFALQTFDYTLFPDLIQLRTLITT